MLYGIAYLQFKLAMKRLRVLKRYEYYEMKNFARDFGISTPPDLRYWFSVLGWCAKAVDSIADRLDFRGFRDDVFGLDQIYDQNNRDILFSSAMLGALISACDFIYIGEDDNGFPRLQVIDGYDATGIIDPITNLLFEGYAVLERDPKTKKPTMGISSIELKDEDGIDSLLGKIKAQFLKELEGQDSIRIEF